MQYYKTQWIEMTEESIKKEKIQYVKADKQPLMDALTTK